MMPSWLSKDISLGNLITLAATLITLYKFHISNVARIVEIETKVNFMWSRLKTRLQINDEEDE